MINTTPHHRRERHKPHKKLINDMKERFFSARSTARSKNFPRKIEEELCYLQNEIETRWFRFFADHYIEKAVDDYCNLVHTNGTNR